MKNRVILLLVLFPFLASSCFAEEVYVKVRQTKLRKEPKYWAQSVGNLKFAEALPVESEDDGWFKVKTKNGRIGFVHVSAVSDRPVKLDEKFSVAGGNRQGVDEVALAGKGFNPETERAYSRSASNVNFRAVDGLDSYNVSQDQVTSFLRQGKLLPEG
ncbi:MAG: SH3 domain-containing protein [Bdellovibrionales bacterium]|nr:SH3 domain-containing protein [Bdellovibrionales bacterium]